MKPIVESYVPPAGIRHAVTAGETWISLAKRIGIDPWDLIEFNFPGIKLVKQRDFQQATRQVNCKRRSRPIRKGLAWGLQSVDQRVCKSLAGGMEAATTENYEVRP
ncbi:hypothetical protein JQ637_27905, partial [Bradyrhizobium diazoefficiens]|nr:hypothetical protein [Bradyrhizobium diazoefficiens]